MPKPENQRMLALLRGLGKTTGASDHGPETGNDDSRKTSTRAAARPRHVAVCAFRRSFSRSEDRGFSWITRVLELAECCKRPIPWRIGTTFDERQDVPHCCIREHWNPDSQRGHYIAP